MPFVRLRNGAGYRVETRPKVCDGYHYDEVREVGPGGLKPGDEIWLPDNLNPRTLKLCDVVSIKGPSAIGWTVDLTEGGTAIKGIMLNTASVLLVISDGAVPSGDGGLMPINILDELEKLPLNERVKSLQKAGILDKEGRLTEEYEAAELMEPKNRSQGGTMTIIEALKLARDSGGETWVRPVTLRGSASGYFVRRDTTFLAPSARGGDRTMSARVSDLVCEWETVDGDTISDEMDALLGRKN